ARSPIFTPALRASAVGRKTLTCLDGAGGGCGIEAVFGGAGVGSVICSAGAEADISCVGAVGSAELGAVCCGSCTGCCAGAVAAAGRSARVAGGSFLICLTTTGLPA